MRLARADLPLGSRDELHPALTNASNRWRLPAADEGDTVEVPMRDAPSAQDGIVATIGGAILMLSDENAERGHLSPSSIGGSGSSIMFYTDDVDGMFNRAVSLGAKADQAPSDMFWGDRMGNLTDPFGHLWAIATHKEDVAPAEMERRMAAMSDHAG